MDVDGENSGADGLWVPEDRLYALLSVLLLIDALGARGRQDSCYLLLWTVT
jgi:hypothetical protein